MQSRAVFVLLVVAGLGSLAAAPAGAQTAAQQARAERAAQAKEAAQTHVRHLAEAFNGTPEGQGLLPTARAEAEIAVRHAGLAANDTTNLDAMKLHVGHVMHAVDPTTVESGPGLGYGMKQAAEGVVRHVDMFREMEGTARRVREYGRRVAHSAQSTVERADSIIVLGQQIREATTAPQAAELLGDLTEVSNRLLPGIDANRDGGVGWRTGEAGLEVTRQNLEILVEAARAEPDSAAPTDDN